MRIETAHRRRFFVNDLEHYGSGIAGKGFLPGEHRENDNAQREDVGAGVNIASLHLLRRHIGRRSHYPHGARNTFARQHLGNPEIRDFGAPIHGHQDVCRLQVAVDHLIPMRVIKPLRHLPHNIERFRGGGRGVRLENLLQGHTRYQFHDDATGVVFRIIEGVVNGNDRGVSQSAGRPDFAHKHFMRAAGSFPRRSAEGENFQGNFAADGGVGSPVDNTHGAPAQLGNDIVSSDLIHGLSSR
jgi:hypothetical protein